MPEKIKVCKQYGFHGLLFAVYNYGGDIPIYVTNTSGIRPLKEIAPSCTITLEEILLSYPTYK